jgi:hypothetical protein
MAGPGGPLPCLPAIPPPRRQILRHRRECRRPGNADGSSGTGGQQAPRPVSQHQHSWKQAGSAVIWHMARRWMAASRQCSRQRRASTWVSGPYCHCHGGCGSVTRVAHTICPWPCGGAASPPAKPRQNPLASYEPGRREQAPPVGESRCRARRRPYKQNKSTGPGRYTIMCSTD